MPIQKKIPSLEEVEALINDATENFKDSIKNPTVLSSEDLNTLYGDSKLGYYFGGGGNSCGNKPEGVSAFGLFVVKTASGNYSQLMFAGKNNYYDLMKRDYISGSWGEWSYVTDRNKLNISVGCDHEYEITGKTGHEYAVAVPDGQALIKRINGQTRRKSLNLLDFNKIVPGSSFSYINGVYTATNANNGAWLFNDYVFYGKFTIALMLISKPDSDTTFTTYNVTDSGNQQLNSFSGLHNYELNKIYVKTFTSLSTTNLRIVLWNNDVPSNFKFKIWAVQGTYTADTMPPFEPYDDTLVNSKCNLKSTSRNLLKITEQGSLSLSGVSITIDANTIIMNGTATSSNNFLISTQGFDIKSTYSLKVFFEQGVITGYPSVWLLAEDGTNTAFGINGVEQSYSINYKVKEIKLGFTQGDVFNNVKFKPMLVYGSTAPTEYEPYEESSMLVDKELGEFDYIDNVGHLLVKQTSELLTFDGSSDEDWVSDGVDSSTGMKRFRIYLTKDFYGNTGTDLTKGVVNLNRFAENLGLGAYNSTKEGWNLERSYGNTKLAFTTTIQTLEEWKAYLQANAIQFVYKLLTLTTEPIQLEAGYQVWNSGLQIQETETIPYVLEKEYAVSLYSQILAVTSIVNSIPDDVASKSRVDQTYIKKDAFSIDEDGKLIIDV